jgi:2-keto-4-pentenoate hydratase
MTTHELTVDFFADLRIYRRTADRLPDDLRPPDMAAAYACQDALVERLLAHHGGARAGYKVACTNPIAQDMLKVDAPVYGCLISSAIYPSPAQLKARHFTLMGIEAEFAFEMADDVPATAAPYTAETIAAYVGAAFPAIEIVDHRLGDWSRYDARSLIADNAIHGAWIPGVPYATWRDLDLGAHAVKVNVNGELKASGQGKAALGHPLNVLAWLANALPEQGKSLQQGEYITTGVCTDHVYLAQPGDTIEADFGVMGMVEILVD